MHLPLLTCPTPAFALAQGYRTVMNTNYCFKAIYDEFKGPEVRCFALRSLDSPVRDGSQEEKGVNRV